MLSFDLSTIASKAVPVDGRLSADDPIWAEGDAIPAGGVDVSGRLSSAGSGRYYFSGHIEGQIETTCRRCLTDVSVPVKEDVHLLYAQADEDELDDPDVYILEPRSRDLDLREAVREQWLLAVPAFSLCREECRGLCPTCGADLNAGPCSCTPATDHRWDALRSLHETD